MVEMKTDFSTLETHCKWIINSTCYSQNYTLGCPCNLNVSKNKCVYSSKVFRWLYYRGILDFDLAWEHLSFSYFMLAKCHYQQLAHTCLMPSSWKSRCQQETMQRTHNCDTSNNAMELVLWEEGSANGSKPQPE